MSEIEAVIERLRACYAAADRRGAGAFTFVAQIANLTGGCVCAISIASDTAEARKAAAQSLTG